MLSYNFERILMARGIDKPFSFFKKAGFSDSFSTRLKNNVVRRVNLSDLEKLCLLLHCTPNDFCEWVPDKGQKLEKDHPLNTLRRSDKVFDLTRTLNSVPLEKLDEVEALINQALKPE